MWPRSGSRRRPPPPGGSSPVVDPLRGLRHPATLTLVLVTERLAAEHPALPIRGTARRRAAGQLGRLAHCGQEAGGVCRFLHQGEQPHPPVALGAGEDVHGETARQELRPRAVSAGRPRPVGLAARCGRLLGGRIRLEVGATGARSRPQAVQAARCDGRARGRGWPPATARHDWRTALVSLTLPRPGLAPRGVLHVAERRGHAGRSAPRAAAGAGMTGEPRSSSLLSPGPSRG